MDTSRNDNGKREYRNEHNSDEDGLGIFESEQSRRKFLRSTATVGATASVGAGMMSSVAGADTGTGDGREVVFVGDRVDGTLTVADANTYEVLGEVNVNPDGTSPDGIIKTIAKPIVDSEGGGENYVQDVDISPDGKTAYVARGHLADVVAIDIESGEIEWETELWGLRADHQVISHDGKYLYTADIIGVNRVWKIDTETGEKLENQRVTHWPHGNHVHEMPGFDGKTLVNGSLGRMLADDSRDGNHRLTFMDADTLEVKRIVDFEEGVRPIAFTSDASKCYVQISYFHGFHEYDVANDEVTRSMDLPKTQYVPENKEDYPLQSAHHGIEVSPDDEYICVAGTTSHAAFVVRRSDLELMNTIHVGKNPYWCTNAPDGEHCFVAVKGEDVVSVINYEDAEEVERIDVGKDPMVMDTAGVSESVLDGLQDADGGSDDDGGGFFDLFGL